jgi:benzoate membrane transport protein
MLPDKNDLANSTKSSMIKEFTLKQASSGMIAWLFGVTGPLLIVLQAAEQANLDQTTIISWIFAIYVVGGTLSVGLSIYYRQPIAVAFSIPGAILVGTALSHHSFSDIIGVYLITGIVILLFGLSGIVDKMMSFIPMPIVMGMVSGVLLPFGLNILVSLTDDFFLNGIILLSFLIFSMFPVISRYFPPILGALLLAFLLIIFFGFMEWKPSEKLIAVPSIYMPTFSWAAIAELVIPLTVTVIAIQNAQGISIMKASGYKPPINTMTNWSGIGSLVNGIFGAHSACIAGPMTAILTSDQSDKKGKHYTASIVMGILWIGFGLFAPVMIGLIQGIPSSVVYLLGGLAMLGVLSSSLRSTFSGSFQMGALFSFLITLSDVTILGIGSPFWGMVGGVLISAMVEKADFKKKSQPAV